MVTAKELLEQLKHDKEYQAARKAKDKQRAELQALLDEDQKGLLQELSDVGFHVKSAWYITTKEDNYLAAVPILKKHLHIEHHHAVADGIIRALSKTPRLSHDEGLWDTLVDLFVDPKLSSHLREPIAQGLEQFTTYAKLDGETKSKRIADIKKLANYEGEDDASVIFRAIILGKKRKVYR